jgi:hypothetical protein
MATLRLDHAENRPMQRVALGKAAAALECGDVYVVV